MNSLFRSFRHILLGLSLLISSASAEDLVLSAKALAAQLSRNLQDGSSLVRLKLEVRQPSAGTKTLLQLQVKSRRSQASTELVYQVLWPKERKGESFVLRQSADHPASGSVLTLPDSLVPIPRTKLKDGIFGSDLSYEDLIENFFAWENQAIVGTETIDRIACQILESKPGKSEHVSYLKVRSWIDLKRMVVLRVEKYSESGKLACRIDTTRVAKDDRGRVLASSFSLQRPGQDSVTEIEGSNSKHDVTFADSDFTPEALRVLK